MSWAPKSPAKSKAIKPRGIKGEARQLTKLPPYNFVARPEDDEAVVLYMRAEGYGAMINELMPMTRGRWRRLRERVQRARPP